MVPPDSEIRQSFTARALRRNRKMILIFAVPSIFFSVLLWPLALATRPIMLGPIAATAACSLIAFVSTRAYVRRRDVIATALIKLLKEDPSQVVWIYILRQQTTSGRALQETVHVQCFPRKTFLLYSLEASQCATELARWCPHAHVGWSKELEDVWMRDPARLRRAASPSAA